ncbi:ATP-binding cassette domain-containing protein, partial [Cryobacterium algoricola]|uniref:ATP-binding cassette domain-containing protein n=1 Tax=Cryobacterium algoricola TaxID=1259183 RepID=UPI001F540CA4
ATAATSAEAAAAASAAMTAAVYAAATGTVSIAAVAAATAFAAPTSPQAVDAELPDLSAAGDSAAGAPAAASSDVPSSDVAVADVSETSGLVGALAADSAPDAPASVSDPVAGAPRGGSADSGPAVAADPDGSAVGDLGSDTVERVGTAAAVTGASAVTPPSSTSSDDGPDDGTLTAPAPGSADGTASLSADAGPVDSVDTATDADSSADASADSSGPRPVLRGVSFSAPRGLRTALVGPSGAGKSTILALIERFYDPNAGVVRLGGLDIRTLDRTALRSQIGYVEQDAPVLAGSLRDNLVLSAPDATDEECLAVLHAVNLGEVLDRDPAGLGAAVGESGVMLSGGERQRLAIARALLAAPPILLLDESTSSLDGVNEQLMRAAIDAVAVDRTLIVIAHRLSTVVDSDQIVVLDHGEVIGTGTHSELVVSTPLYRELAKHQLLV